MQIKLYTIPLIGGEELTAEMNRFLRSKKLLQVESHLVQHTGDAYWSFCIRYIETQHQPDRKTAKVDYKETLDEASFQRFSDMRKIRKEVAQKDAVPAYAVFTDAELAALAKIEELSLAGMKQVKGIGSKKIEKYGTYFISNPSNEKTKPSDTTD